MSVLSLGTQHLTLRSAEDVHEVFQRLGYDVFDPEPFEGDDLDQLDLDEADRETVNRAYVVAQRDNHTIYLYEVSDLRQTRLRGLAWHALQRGTALLVVTRDYREVLFVDPRFVGKPNKSSVRVNKLKLVSSDPTRHDLDTLNAIHAHRRSGQQVYDAQAEAFNVTTITRKFYDEYRRHYEHARAMIRQYNPGVREFQNSDQTDKLHAFTQRLLGRLMFLYFLQRKGWLGERQKFLTEKYNETMRRHAHELHGDGETFHYYSEVLEPLFFQTMNTQRPGNITLWSGIRIPYLNGGLFDESRDPAGPIIIPDVLFDPNSNEGLLAFFNRYNFTIEDDTPLEQDVSVDPEMLGKVFENMLEERDRGQSGSFYTPRTIVAYMCQEALVGYLEESAKVPRETTRAQFDPDSEVRYTPEEAERVNTALDSVTVLDPAVGSGSFLIGMLNEIIRLRKTCYTVLHEGQDAPNSTLADWKEAIIRDTLYGVDIKPEAIEIAQLRLWLALVVDQTLEQARPLPNLDYKLMAGNSLIETIDGEPVLGESAKAMMGADVTPKQPTLGLFETDKERFKLDELRAKFFRATPEERRKLRDDITAQERRIVSTSLREKAEAQQQIINQIGKLVAQTGGKLKASDERKLKTAVEKLARLTKLQDDMAKPDYALPFFLYRLHFSEVFDTEKGKGGFDIVVANPPYVDTKQGSSSDDKDERELAYGWVDDLYSHFIYRGFELARTNAVLAYITSDTYFTISTKEHVRKLLQKKNLLSLMQVSPFDATVDTAIFIAGNRDSQTPDITFVQSRFASEAMIAALIKSPNWSGSYAVRNDGSVFNIKSEDLNGLRRYSVPVEIYRRCIKFSFFEPSYQNSMLYDRFVPRLNQLYKTWGDKISTSSKFTAHRKQIESHINELQRGDITFAGLIAEGGQGMATGDNGRFLGYLENTQEAQKILNRREELIEWWKKKPQIYKRFQELSTQFEEFADVVEELKDEFNGKADLGLKRGEIYRIVPADQIFDVTNLSETERTKIINEGLKGEKVWIPYRKGDKGGNRWTNIEDLFVHWSSENVSYLQKSPKARWQGYQYFLTSGVTWSDTANHAPIKARLAPISIFDVSGMRLTPISAVSSEYFLAFLNTNFAGYFNKKFYNNTQKYQIGDLRLLPIVIPTKEQHKKVVELVRHAVKLQAFILREEVAEHPDQVEISAKSLELAEIEQEINQIFAEIYGVEDLGEFTEF